MIIVIISDEDMLASHFSMQLDLLKNIFDHNEF